jgi:hypothetical protein
MFVGIFLAMFFLRISLAKILLLILLIFSIFILIIKLYPKSQARIIDSTYNQIFEKTDSSNNFKINFNMSIIHKHLLNVNNSIYLFLDRQSKKFQILHIKLSQNNTMVHLEYNSNRNLKLLAWHLRI